jgi:hypothetical protein
LTGFARQRVDLWALCGKYNEKQTNKTENIKINRYNYGITFPGKWQISPE